MTIEHSLLTGASLHEPKGVAAASSGTVYVANGVGSGSWTTLSSFNAFGGQLMHVRDQRTSGSSAQGLSSATWNKRDLQTTVTNEISSATLTSSVISLPAGTYFIEASSAVYNSQSIANNNTASAWAQIRLRNTTDGTTLLAGTGTYFSLGVTAPTAPSTVIMAPAILLQVPLKGRFTLAGTKNIEFQMYPAVSGGSTPTGGTPLSTGEVEVYTDILIWKVA